MQIQAIEEAFAERDRHLNALRREVQSLSAQGVGKVEMPADLDARLSAIKSRIEEQERSLRHVLTMMIDYFESAGTREAA